MTPSSLRARWTRFWLRRCGRSRPGRCAAWFAGWFAPPFRGMRDLAREHAPLYIAPSARIHHERIEWGRKVFVGDRVVIYRYRGGGGISIGDRVDLHMDVVLETGVGGTIRIGEDTHLQPRCFLSAHAGGIEIGSDVEIGPGSFLFPHDHRFDRGRPISGQGLRVKGDIRIGDHAWLGAGVVVLSGAEIGEGAVVGAGSVVTGFIPPETIAAGIPAKVIKPRPSPEREDA